MSQRHRDTEIYKIVRWVFPVLLVLFVTACGFHLRGAYQLPVEMSRTFVQASNQNSELVRSLQRSLKANDIQLVEEVSDATAVLKITREKQTRRILSVDSRGRAREYALSYELAFQLASRQSAFAIAEQTIKLEREYLFDTEDVLGKGREEATLIKDMQQDMVRLILLRLQASHESTSRSD